jgi:acetyl-CoA carboxylase carboxyltransferase component
MSVDNSDQPTFSNLSLVQDGHLEPVSERVTTSEVKMRPVQRLGLLCDEGSLRVRRSAVISERMGARASAGDGVVAAAGRIGGRPVFCYAQDSSFAGGALGEAHAETIVSVLRLARQPNVPVIGFIE